MEIFKFECSKRSSGIGLPTLVVRLILACYASTVLSQDISATNNTLSMTPKSASHQDASEKAKVAMLLYVAVPLGILITAMIVAVLRNNMAHRKLQQYADITQKADDSSSNKHEHTTQYDDDEVYDDVDLENDVSDRKRRPNSVRLSTLLMRPQEQHYGRVEADGAMVSL